VLGSPGGIDLDDTLGPTVVTPGTVPTLSAMQADTEL
jgi:hypothetical protein